MPRPARHSQSVQAAVKMANATKFVIARPQRGRGNLAAPCWITGHSRRIRQLYAAGRRGHRPLQGRVQDASAFPRFPRRFAPRNDKSDSFAPPNYCCKTCDCQWRSLTAATDAIGFYVFIDTRYESFVRSRERHAAPLQWCTPFNDSRYELEVPSRDCHVASLLAMTIRKCIPF